jgi:hypothetical protein
LIASIIDVVRTFALEGGLGLYISVRITASGPRRPAKINAFGT